MARYNEILVGRYNRMLQKLFSMKGGAVAPQLASEIAPTFPFFSGAEHRILESWSRFALGINIATQGAGNQNSLRLVNPKGSNIVAVLERLLVVTPAIDVGILDYFPVAPAALVNANTPVSLDNRDQRQFSALLLSNGPVVVGGSSTAMVVGTLAGTTADFIVTDIQEIALAPNSALQIRCGALNSSMIATMLWRERFLEDSERT
jgi:hypothetical protein